MAANVITGLPKGLMKQLRFVLKRITTESIDDVLINGGKVAIGESADDVLVKLGSAGAVADITKRFKLGVTAASVLLSLVIEFVFFWFNYRKAKNELLDRSPDGREDDEYKQKMREMIGESLGGFLLGTTLGLISLNFFWTGFILGILGNIVGRLVGQFFGRKVHAIRSA